MKLLCFIRKDWINFIFKKFSEKKGLAQIPLMIGLLLVAVSIPIATNLVQKNTENRSKAADGTPPAGGLCAQQGGECHNITWKSTLSGLNTEWFRSSNYGSAVGCYDSTLLANYCWTHGCKYNGVFHKELVPFCDGSRIMVCQSGSALDGTSVVGDSFHCVNGQIVAKTTYDCSRCSANYGCTWAVFKSNSADCTNPVPGTTPTYTANQTCPRITTAGADNSRCTTGGGTSGVTDAELTKACTDVKGECQTNNGSLPTIGGSCTVNGSNGKYISGLCGLKSGDTYYDSHRCCKPITTIGDDLACTSAPNNGECIPSVAISGSCKTSSGKDGTIKTNLCMSPEHYTGYRCCVPSATATTCTDDSQCGTNKCVGGKCGPITCAASCWTPYTSGQTDCSGFNTATATYTGTGVSGTTCGVPTGKTPNLCCTKTTVTPTCSSTNCGACVKTNCSSSNCIWNEGTQKCLPGDNSLAQTTCKGTTGTVKKCVGTYLYTCIAGSPQWTGGSPENCTNGCVNGACVTNPTTPATGTNGTCTACADTTLAKGRNLGNFNCMGNVDVQDFLDWKNEYVIGDQRNRKEVRSDWKGDADCNGIVNLNDLEIWLRNRSL